MRGAYLAWTTAACVPSTADRRTHKWRDVVELVAAGADVSQVANATIRAADSAFSFINNDSGANQAVGLMTQLGLAAGEKNPLKHLRSQGIDIPDNTSLPGTEAARSARLGVGFGERGLGVHAVGGEEPLAELGVGVRGRADKVRAQPRHELFPGRHVVAQIARPIAPQGDVAQFLSRRGNRGRRRVRSLAHDDHAFRGEGIGGDIDDARAADRPTPGGGSRPAEDRRRRAIRGDVRSASRRTEPKVHLHARLRRGRSARGEAEADAEETGGFHEREGFSFQQRIRGKVSRIPTVWYTGFLAGVKRKMASQIPA